MYTWGSDRTGERRKGSKRFRKELRIKFGVEEVLQTVLLYKDVQGVIDPGVD